MLSCQISCAAAKSCFHASLITKSSRFVWKTLISKQDDALDKLADSACGRCSTAQLQLSAKQMQQQQQLQNYNLCKIVHHTHQLRCEWCCRYSHAQVIWESQACRQRFGGCLQAAQVRKYSYEPGDNPERAAYHLNTHQAYTVYGGTTVQQV